MKFIRWILSFALLVGVYFETGIFTVLALLLSMIAIETLCHVWQSKLKK